MYFRRAPKDFVFQRHLYTETDRLNSLFEPFGTDFVMHPQYFPPSMLESENISFDQGRPVYAPGVNEPEIPAVLNGIDFKEDIEENSNIVKKKETGEIQQQTNDMKMCISFDKCVTKNLCKISYKYTMPVVDNGKKDLPLPFNPGSYHCIKQLHNIALNELDQRHRGTFPIKDSITDFDKFTHLKYASLEMLHLHPLYILRERQRRKYISLHNFDSSILRFYPRLTAPKLCFNSIFMLSKVVTWFVCNSYTKVINLIDGTTVPIYANRKDAMNLYYPRNDSQNMPLYNIHGQIIKTNVRYVEVVCSKNFFIELKRSITIQKIPRLN
ncbi:PREDICTED: uncharacterized protein LOC108567413 [Nicrophorus vespilloides]|uniref:Uncharacterized protein LOC108567413 n=1 Tax=Nicrophorus vespilloides TaxID=110193 RepID=A0ABM1N936_NICVS|nr:PREDICTED: uncharacterized protein LOC108567413 [Nicrophorus vespilloides]XP_017783335.1 PREDICTED: uncharacterized protein LOC108567413 [Nicrophorus vespilloides]XP_017783336.1 PREDICTED: uncharacterized protein LOC108567413 [Nicrophorus vespilloides]